MSNWIFNLKEWMLTHKKELIFGIIIFFVASISFGLGYLANREMNTTPIIIEKASG